MTLSRLRTFDSAWVTLTAACVSAAISSVAVAQDAPVQGPSPGGPAPVAPPPTSPEPAPLPAVAPPLAEPTPAPYAPTSAEPTGISPSEPTAQKETTPAADEETPWYSNFKIGGFVDAYAAVRSDRNKRPVFLDAETGMYRSAGGYFHDAYAQANGFALAFAGLDASYTGEKFGATISLRFGPGVNRFYAADMSSIGIQYVTQAYVTYKPVDALTFDLGQFGTIYGAEVLESWKNVNYTRGALYYAMQPFWHTGLRANLAVNDVLALNGLVVNGVNNAFENNKTPSLGLQAVITAGEHLTIAAGYLGALNPTQGGNGPFQNFFDLVATVTAGGFKLVANADLNLYKPGPDADGENFWGVSIAPSYAFNDIVGIGLRFEYLQDSANQWLMTTTKTLPADEGAELADKAALTTLTATIDVKPIPGVSALVLRPEFRVEFANNYYFYNRSEELTKTFYTVMLGAVVTSL